MNEENEKNAEIIEESSKNNGAGAVKVMEVTTQKDDLLPDEIDSIPLARSAAMIVNNIIQTDNVDEIKKLNKLFEINQAKKNALRVIKLNSLLDIVTDQAVERFTKRPYEVTNKEVFDAMQVVQNQIEKSQKIIDKVDDSPMIQINQQNNSINVTVGEDPVDRESKERVIDAVNALLKAFKEPAPKEVISVPQDVDINKKETKGDIK